MNRALLVIDVQNIYTSSDGALAVTGSAKIVQEINRLIKLFEKSGEPIYLVKHVHRTDGSDLGRMFDFSGEAEDPNFLEGTSEVEYDDNLYVPRTYTEFTKTRYSCFPGTILEKSLKDRNIDTLVICGFMTNYCCESTAREAHDKDYYVDFVMGATGCPDASRKFNQARIKEVVGASLSGGIARVHSSAKRFT